MRNLLISMVANFLFWWTKQIFFLVIKLEPRLLSWLQPRKKHCVPTELDVSILATGWSILKCNFLTSQTLVWLPLEISFGFPSNGKLNLDIMGPKALCSHNMISKFLILNHLCKWNISWNLRIIGN